MKLLAKIKNLFNACNIWQILFLATLLRLGWYFAVLFLNNDGFWLYDSTGYWNIAFNLKENSIYSQAADFPYTEDVFRTPLYPMFIYPTLFFDLSGNSIPFFQCLLDVFTCFILYKWIFAITTSKKYALFAAFLFALNLPAIIFANYVLAESFFLFLITFFGYRFTLCLNNTSYKNVAFCALVGGLAVLCKPVAFFILLPSVLFLLKNGVNAKTVSLSLLFVICFYFVQFPWMQRNKNEYGHYFNSLLGEHLINRYHAAHVEALATERDYFEVQEERTNRFMVKFQENPYEKQYEYAKLIEKEAYKTFWEYKWIFCKEHLKECLKFCFYPMGKYISFQLGEGKSINELTKFIFVPFQLFYSTFAFGVIAFTLLMRVFRKIKLSPIYFYFLILLIIAAQFNTMPYTDARMRLPWETTIIVLFVLSFFYWKKRAQYF